MESGESFRADLTQSPEVVRIYLPPDGNSLLSVMDHCLKSTNYVNAVVSDKQEHLQYLTMEQAVTHCTKGIGSWPHFSTDAGGEPDVVMASCGDISTHEMLAAVDLLLRHFPELKIRVVNVVDLFKLISPAQHPHGLDDKQWVSLFTADKPIIFNFHSYPWMIHRLTYKRPGALNLHVRGYVVQRFISRTEKLTSDRYSEKGNIDTPLELAIRNQTDRFSLAMDAIDHMPHLHNRGSAARQSLLDEQIAARNEAFETGMDPPKLSGWRWPSNRNEKPADALPSR